MRYFLFVLISLFFCCKTKESSTEGGFDYPTNVSNSDTNFYHYQLKNIESEKDAFWDAYDYLVYRPFDEPNLSLKPQPKETYRLTYGGGYRSAIIITLTEDQLLIKKGNPAVLYGEDTSKLTDIERFHFSFLQMRFPIDTTEKKTIRKHYTDSLVKLYPQLLDPAYYHKIIEKTLVPSGEKFTYSLTKIKLTRQQYSSLIQQIDSSGFWAKPYKIECKGQIIMDGDQFTLEANTRKKYKIVSVEGCPNDTTAFTKACQKLVDFAKMGKEIHLIWNYETATTADTIELH